MDSLLNHWGGISMNKQKCIAAIYKAADLYKEHLLNKNLLLLYKEAPNKTSAIITSP